MISKSLALSIGRYSMQEKLQSLLIKHAWILGQVRKWTNNTFLILRTNALSKCMFISIILFLKQQININNIKESNPPINWMGEFFGVLSL